MACGVRRLFGTEGDLEDEDFLSAVEDAELRFLPHGAPGPQPLPHGRGPTLRPLAGGCRTPTAPRGDHGTAHSERGERPPPGTLKRPRDGSGPGPPAPPIPTGPPRSCGSAPGAPSPLCPGSPSVGPQPPRGPPCPMALQSPVVTNRLVLLLTAAKRAPGAAPRPPAHGTARRFPGPAGILPQQWPPGKLPEEILLSAPQSPCHGAMAKPRAEDVPSSALPTQEDFGKGPWLSMKAELEVDERDPACFLHTYSVVMVLRKAALKQLPRNKVPSMAVMIKTLTRTNVDAGAVFRDPTGEMQGTVHRLLLEERQSELRPGSVLLLRQVGVFSPSHRNHYLNVTPNNLLKIYPAEPEGSCLPPSPAPPEVPAHPSEPPQVVPAPGHRGGHWRPHGAEQAPGQEEPEGTGGCDVDDLDGLLGELPEDFFSSPAQSDCC